VGAVKKKNVLYISAQVEVPMRPHALKEAVARGEADEALKKADDALTQAH
jgi:hypothetical protein